VIARHSETDVNSPLKISRGPTLEATVALLHDAKLPTEDLTAAHCEDFFFAGTRDQPSGLVGLEIFGDVALLRSLVVVEERRGTGEGAALVNHAETVAQARGVKVMYLLTTTAEHFFARHGYARAARDTAPAAISATREFASICPASSTFMFRRL
jgi:amino-acid N-acetyltransferase